MRIEFCVSLQTPDYDTLNLDNNLDLIWTHYKCIDWLDLLNYSHERRDEFSTTECRCYLSYWIDEHTLDFILLKWPQILEPVRDYEKVRIIK